MGITEMDREKVMQALDDSLKNQHCGFVDGVGDVYAVSEETIKNIIALLKEQESIIDSLKSDLRETLDVVADRGNVVRCKDCKWYDEQISMCDNCRLPRERTFFCADGKRRIDDD